MDPLTMAALITGGSQIIGGLLGSSSAKSQNKAAAQQAQNEMDFQERMSSTSHQREVADLKAAGLNPILSAHGGASSPGGAMAPVVNTSEPLRDSLKNSAASMAQVMLTRELANTEKTKQTLNTVTAAKSAAQTGPWNFLTRGLDAVDRVTANSAKWLGTKTAGLNMPRFRTAKG